MVFNFTKQPEVDVAKTTASGKSHVMRAVCKNLKAEASESVERKLQSSLILPNDGYSTLVRKVEKRSSLSDGEEL